MDLQLKRLRREKGYQTQQSFADAFGVPKRQVTAWESGERKLSLERACDVADFLGCSLDELAGRDFLRDTTGRLPPSDLRLVERYHSLSDGGRETVDAVMEVQASLGENEVQTDLMEA